MAAGSIVFDLLMKTGSFETSSKKAEKRLNDLQKEAKKVATAMGVAFAAGAGAMVYALKETIDAADETSKAAQKIGVTTEALSGLQYAAEMSGVSTDDLQKSMLKLAKGAADGNEAFEAMGINVKDASGNLKSTDALMLEVADKFKGYKDGAEKSALAMELFGKSGAEMIPLLNGGSAAIGEMTAEAEELGIILDEQTGKRAEAFGDNLTRLQKAGQGVTTQLMSEMLPALIGVTDGFIDTVKQGGFVEKTAKVLTTGFRLLASGVVIVGGAFKLVGDYLGGTFALIVEAVTGVISGTSSALTSIGSALKLAANGDFAAAGKALSGTFDGYGEAMERVKGINDAVGADMVANLKGTVDAFGKVWEDGEVKIDEGAKKVADGATAPLVGAAAKAKAAADKIKKEMEALRKKMEEEGKKLTESMMTPAEKRTKEDTKTNQLAAGQFIDPETQARALAASKKQYDDWMAAQYATLKDGLLSEEAALLVSHQKRIAAVKALTGPSEEEKQASIKALEEKFAADQQSRLRDGLKTEYELAKEAHQKRIDAIKEMTTVSEEDRAKAIAELDSKFEAERNAAKLSRYSDLLTEQDRLAADFQARINQIADDSELSDEERTARSLAAYEAYTKAKGALDDEQLAKKKAAEEAQIAAMTKGFEGAAELAKVFGGEQSKEYAAMFAASKAYALAMNGIEQSKAIAKAWGENNYFVAGGLTVALIAQFASLASSIGGASFGGTRADGGDVKSGMKYLTSERGGEMFIPDTNGTIIPNDLLQPAAQGSNIRIVNAYDSSHVADFMGSADGERVIMNAVKKNQAAVRAMARV